MLTILSSAVPAKEEGQLVSAMFATTSLKFRGSEEGARDFMRCQEDECALVRQQPLPWSKFDEAF